MLKGERKSEMRPGQMGAATGFEEVTFSWAAYPTNQSRPQGDIDKCFRRFSLDASLQIRHLNACYREAYAKV